MIYNFTFVADTAGGKYPPLTPWQRVMVFCEFGFFCVYFGASFVHYTQFRILEAKACGKRQDLSISGEENPKSENDPFFDPERPGEGSMPVDVHITAYSHLCYSSAALNDTAGFWFGMACPRMAYLYRFLSGIEGILDAPISKSNKVWAVMASGAISCLFLWAGFNCILIYIRRSTYIFSEEPWSMADCLLFIALLNNIGSITDEERVKKNTFIDVVFAGEDGVLHGSEMEVVDSFLALVAMALVKRQGIVAGYLTYASLRSSDLQRLVLKEEVAMVDDRRNAWRMLGNSLQRAWVPPMLIFLLGNAISGVTDLTRKVVEMVRKSKYVQILLPQEAGVEDAYDV